MQSKLKQLGYTLVGMSITLAIMGLLVGSATSRLELYYKEKSLTSGQETVNDAVSAVERFVKQNGYYPCPARLAADSDDADYGMSISDCRTAGYVNFATNGYYVEPGSNGGNIIRGALPFRVLNIMPSRAGDRYDMKLEYAVTANLTDKSTYQASAGEIEVVGDSSSSILPSAGKAHFVIFSHGRDRAGAYSNESGLNAIACSAAKDGENCDGDGVYRSMPVADVGIHNVNHFDDFVGLDLAKSLPIWMEASNDENNIWYDTSVAGNVAIGYADNDRGMMVPITTYGTGTISNFTKDNPPVITTATNHGLANGEVVYITGLAGFTSFGSSGFVNAMPYKIAILNTTSFSLQFLDGTNVDATSFVGNYIADSGRFYKAYSSPKTITLFSKAAAAVLTTTTHGWATGDIVYIYNVAGFTSYTGGLKFSNNKFFKITVKSGTTFNIATLDGTTITSTSFVGTYTGSSGRVYKVAPLPEFYNTPNLSINGEAKASGKLMARYLCDGSRNERDSANDMSYCFEIDDLFATSNCSVGEFVSSIDSYGDGGMRITCTGTVEYRCPAGKVVTAMSNSGITCGYPQTSTALTISNGYCEAKNVTLCDESDVVPLASTLSGVTRTVNSGIGDSDYSEIYKCTNNQWQFQSSSGSCDIDGNSGDGLTHICSTSNPYNYLAHTIYSNEAPRSGWSGLWDVNVSNQCEDEFTPPAPVSASPPDDIACEAGEVAGYFEACPGSAGCPVACGALENGRIYRTKEWKCSPLVWDILPGSSSDCLTADANPTRAYCPEGLTDNNNDGSCETATAITQFRIRKTRCAVSSDCQLYEFRSFDSTNRKWTPWVGGVPQSYETVTNRTWTLTDTHTLNDNKLGPTKNKDSAYRLGEACFENVGVQRACYSPAGSGMLDGLPLYYHYKDCTCQ